MSRKSTYSRAVHENSERGTGGLEKIDASLDDLVEQMQTTASKKGAKALFGATPQELGRAAVAAALKGGRKKR